MSYEIVMPQLSDSMDEGKLISWKVKEGQKVNAGDVLAEVESDKAVMEVQSFKNGTVEQLLAKEGDTISVGKVIAIIQTNQSSDTNSKNVAKQNEKATKETVSATQEESEVQKQQKPQTKSEPKPATVTKQAPEPKKIRVEHLSHDETNGISPKARAKAAQYGVEAHTIMQKTAKNVLHVKDVEDYLKEHYFTPKALRLLEKYGLELTTFTLDHKIDEAEVQAFIDNNETPLPQPLTQMQKAIISNVTASAQKPVYHLYEHIDANLFLDHQEDSITAWLIKIFAKVMMQHDTFRSRLYNDTLITYPTASISVAVADAKKLYMPVVKDANRRSVADIAKELAGFKTKLKENAFSAKDMEGSSFGISNLGMFGVERFDAMINKNDAAIVAIGGLDDGKISVTLTADHRLINGYEAALFMRDLKQEVQNPLNFKD